MKTLRIFSFCFVVLTATRLAADDFLDQVEDALTMNAFQGNVRARLSGLIDLEVFRIDQPPPGLIETNHHFLANARLSLFLDAQIGTQVYVFGQSRVDTGFDPTDHGVQIRLDEYAVRYTPWEDGRFSLQIGKFASVVGNWIPRHLSWENPFITAPLPYENITTIQDKAAPYYGYLTGGLTDAKYNYLPVIWGPSYASGVSVAGRLGHFDYAAEIKNASLSSRPESRNVNAIGFEHPTVSARLGFRPSQIWNFGFSASDGAYFRPGHRFRLASFAALGGILRSALRSLRGRGRRHFRLLFGGEIQIHSPVFRRVALEPTILRGDARRLRRTRAVGS